MGWTLNDLHALPIEYYDALIELVPQWNGQAANDNEP